jgi:type II secretory pathway component PulL
MSFKDLDDINRENQERERAELKEKVVTDINEVFGNLLKRRKIEKEIKKKKRKWWVKLIWLILTLGVLLFLINFILGNIWLLKYFIKNLF